MKTISISRLKATLSEQLEHVARGEVVVVTHRGRAVARIVPVGESEPGTRELAELERAGLVRRGTGRLDSSFWRIARPKDDRAALRRAVEEERETSW